METTLSYDYGRENNNPGWVSRYSFLPEKLEHLNNNFFTFKDGDIWIHHSENVPRTNYYGVQYEHSITTIYNEWESDEKHFKTISLYSNVPYNVEMSTDMSYGVINEDSFVSKDSEWYAYLRRVDSTVLELNDIKNLSTQGIGVAGSWLVNTVTFTFNLDKSTLQVGAALYTMVGSTITYIGTITAYTDTTITVSSPTGPITAGQFVLVGKNKVAESTGVMGFYATIRLYNTELGSSEMFRVTTDVFKSFP